MQLNGVLRMSTRENKKPCSNEQDIYNKITQYTVSCRDKRDRAADLCGGKRRPAAEGGMIKKQEVSGLISWENKKPCYNEQDIKTNYPVHRLMVEISGIEPLTS